MAAGELAGGNTGWPGAMPALPTAQTTIKPRVRRALQFGKEILEIRLFKVAAGRNIDDTNTKFLRDVNDPFEPLLNIFFRYTTGAADLSPAPTLAFGAMPR